LGRSIGSFPTSSDLREASDAVGGLGWRYVLGILAAGGTLVTNRWASAFWVLADAEGNEACITTWQGRD
jgi:hypothetical protein